jgi:hypothetical protein
MGVTVIFGAAICKSRKLVSGIVNNGRCGVTVIFGAALSPLAKSRREKHGVRYWPALSLPQK